MCGSMWSTAAEQNRVLWVLACVAPVAPAIQQPLQRDTWFPHAEPDALLPRITFIAALLNCDHNLLNESVYQR